MPDCKSCKENRAKNIKPPETIPYLAYEGAMARNERAVKRLVIALILAISMIFASNGIWLWCWCQYDYSSGTTTEEVIVEQDARDGGDTNYIGNDGDIINGLSENNDNKDEKNKKTH